MGLVFCYTGKGYASPFLKTIFAKESAFEAHLKSKAHVMAVIDAREKGTYQSVRDILEIDLISDDWLENSELAQTILKKQAKQLLIAQKEKEAREAANYNKNPANFFSCDTGILKLIKKDGDTMVFSHLFETTLKVKEFDGDKFFGCEFIKPEAGLNCRLCNLYMKDTQMVIGHISSQNHKKNYQNFLKKNAGYEGKQKGQNSSLCVNLKDEEGKHVLLKATKGEFIDELAAKAVTVPDLMVDKAAEARKLAEKEAAEKAAAEKEAAEKAAAEKEAAEKAAAEKAAAEKEAAEKATAEKADAEKPVAEKADADKAEENAEVVVVEEAEATSTDDKVSEEVEKPAEDDAKPEVVEEMDAEDAEAKKEEPIVEEKKEEPAAAAPEVKARNSPKPRATPTRGKGKKAAAKKAEEPVEKKEEQSAVNSWCDDY